MAGVVVLIVDGIAGIAAWVLFCKFMNWVETGRFGGGRRG